MDLIRQIIPNRAKIKSKAVAKVFFFIYVRIDRIEEPPRTFCQDSCILYYIFHDEKTKKNQSNWDDYCEETCKQK